MADSLDRSSLALYTVRVGLSLLGFVATVYFARTLGAGGLGVYFTFEAVVQVVSVVSRAGIDSAVVKRVSESDDDAERGRYVGAALLLSTVPLAVSTVGILLFAPQLNSYVGVSAAWFAVAAIVTGSSHWLFIGVLRGERRIVTTAGLELLNALVRIGISVGLLVAGIGVVGLLYGHVAGLLVSALVAFVLSEVPVRIPGSEAVDRLFDFSRYTAGMNVSDLAYNWLDTLLLAFFLTKAVVGVYEAAWRVSAVVMLASQSIGVSLAPTISRWYADGERDRVETAFRGAFTFALVLVVPAVVGVALLGEAFMREFYDFSTGGFILLLLVGEKLLQAPKQITQATLFGIDRPEVVFWTNALFLTANVALNVALIPRFGAVGAAVATGATSGTAALVQFGYLRWRADIHAGVDVRALGWQVAAALLMGGVVFAAIRAVPPTSVLRVLGLVAIGGATYGLVMLGHEPTRTRVVGVVH